MFIGHFAIGLAAKRAAPTISLGALIGAALFLDLLWPAFLMFGWEKVRVDPGNTAFTPLAFDSYSYSHSLIATVGWALLCGALVRAIRGNFREAAIVTLLVASHWALDGLSHRPDLPLALTGSARFGLGLWNSRWATMAVEGAMFALGAWLYGTCTHATNRVGAWAFYSYLATLALIYLANAFGPPPPDWRAVAWSGLGAMLFVIWPAWFDRHRAPIVRESSEI